MQTFVSSLVKAFMDYKSVFHKNEYISYKFDENICYNYTIALYRGEFYLVNIDILTLIFLIINAILLSGLTVLAIKLFKYLKKK